QRWAALFLSMAGRSCLLRYSWFGENSDLFERRVVQKEMPPPNRARMAGGGEGHRVESTPLTDYFTIEFVSVNWKTTISQFSFLISH
ncbi:MAG: hypothetical protein C0610_12550, partial [Desulfobacteraceae bacterium]